MFTGVDWSERDAHMYDRHGITTGQAEEALADPERVVIEPEYASRSGQSVRIIGYAPSLGTILTVIVVVDRGHEYGASGWPANDKDRSIYFGKGGVTDESYL